MLPAVPTRISRRRQLSCCAAMTLFKGLAVQKDKEEFKVWEYEPKPLGPKEVEIRVTHNGLCHSDLHMRDNDWGITAFPLIAGHEVVGEVTALGNEVTGFKTGDRVGYGWLRDSCRSCGFCLRGEENLCKHQVGTIVGAGNFGGFQPVMRAPADFAYHIPRHMSSADAAPLLCAGITVFAPLRRFIKHPGTKVAILGIGGLGHLAVQFAAAMGAEVTALVLTEDDVKEAKALGADDALTSAAAFETKTDYFDVVLNCATARIGGGQMLSLVRSNGTVIQVGIPGDGATLTVKVQDIVFGQKGLTGSLVGGRADMQEMLDFASIKGIKPMIELYKLSDINAAAARVASGKARYRVVMETDSV